MSITSWIDDRVKNAIGAAMTPQNLQKLTDAVVPALEKVITDESARITAQVVASAGDVINDVADEFGKVAGGITNDINSIGSNITVDTTQIVTAVETAVRDTLNQFLPHIPGFNQPPPHKSGHENL